MGFEILSIIIVDVECARDFEFGARLRISSNDSISGFLLAISFKILISSLV